MGLDFLLVEGLSQQMALAASRLAMLAVLMVEAISEVANLLISVMVTGCVLVAILTTMPAEILAEIADHQEVTVKVLEAVDVDVDVIIGKEIVAIHVAIVVIVVIIVGMIETVAILAPEAALVVEIVVATVVQVEI